MQPCGVTDLNLAVREAISRGDQAGIDLCFAYSVNAKSLLNWMCMNKNYAYLEQILSKLTESELYACSASLCEIYLHCLYEKKNARVALVQKYINQDKYCLSRFCALHGYELTVLPAPMQDEKGYFCGLITVTGFRAEREARYTRVGSWLFLKNTTSVLT